MLGLAVSAAKGGAALLTYVKDNLKLYLDFKSNKHDTLKFPCEGSTDFSGTSQYITVSDNDSLDLDGTGYYTIAVWLRADADITDTYTIANKYNSNTGWMLTVTGTNNLRWETGDGSGIDTTKSANDAFSTTVGKWQHCAITGGGGGKTKMYIDGVELGSLVTDEDHNTIATNTQDLYIGCSTDGSSYEWNGAMANLGVWDRALSLEEINSVMRKSYSQLGSVEKTSLVNWWALDNSLDRGADFWDVGVFTQEGSPTTSTYSNGLLNVVGNGNNTGAKFSFPSTGSTSLEGYNQYEFSFDIKITSGGGSGVKIQHHYSNAISSTFNDIIDTTEAPNQEFKRFVTTLYNDNSASANRYFVFVQNGASPTAEFQVKNVVLKPITANDSKGSNHGQLVQEATTTTSVYGGNAPVLPRAVDVAREGEAEAIGNGSLTTSSGGYVDLGNDSVIHFKGSFSVGCWFKTTDATASNEIIMSVNDDGTNDGWLIRLNSSRKLEFGVLLGAITDGGSASNDGDWHHVVGVHESGVGNKLYKNGILVASNTTGTSLSDHVPNFHIGNQDYSTPRALDGSYAQAFAYQGVLTQAQIQSVMESTSYAKIPADVKSTLGAEKVTLLSNWTGSDYTSTITASTNTVNLEADVSSVSASKYLSGAGGIVTGTTNLSAGFYKISFDASWTNAPSTKQFKWYSDGSTVTTETITSGSNVFYKTTTTANGNSQFNIQMNNANQGITLSNITIKEVTNDLVGYWGLDADNSDTSSVVLSPNYGVGITNDLTTGEILGSELAPTSWNVSNATTSESTDYAFSGTTSRKFTTTSTNGYIVGSSTFTTTISKLYKLSFMVYSPSATNIKPKIVQGDGSGWNVFDTITIASGEWVSIVIYFVTAGGGASTNLYFEQATNGATQYLDDISLKEVTSNTGVLI